jgi:thiamine biosynthesis lipoprotein
MGTLFKITTYSDDPEQARRDLKAALDLAEEFAERATDYEPESELNRLTREPVGTPVKVSKQLFEVLLLAQTIAEQTDGTFDPTYGPLTHLWRETARTGRQASDEEIEAARKRCGIEHLTFDEEKQSITVGLENMQLDLGGIAKGFAADLIFDHLLKKGYRQTLVAAAGDIRLGDPPPDKEAWTIGLQTFDLSPSSTLPLKNCAISTSGDLYQRAKIDGKTYSHLIDIRTGLGLTTRRAASVILPEAKLTDPLATVACLMDDPLKILKHYPKASIRVVYEDQKTKPVVSGVFASD